MQHSPCFCLSSSSYRPTPEWQLRISFRNCIFPEVPALQMKCLPAINTGHDSLVLNLWTEEHISSASVAIPDMQWQDRKRKLMPDGETGNTEQKTSSRVSNSVGKDVQVGCSWELGPFVQETLFCSPRGSCLSNVQVSPLLWSTYFLIQPHWNCFSGIFLPQESLLSVLCFWRWWTLKVVL